MWPHLILIAANITNVFIDAYKITKLNRNIRHGINFLCYAIVVASCCFIFHFNLKAGIVFCISAFFNRQITFDIPLNLKRKLKWYYVSLAKPPKAIMDKIEISLFGYNGKAPTIIYGCIWIITVIIYSIIR
jgi:hypothetical protein